MSEAVSEPSSEPRSESTEKPTEKPTMEPAKGSSVAVLWRLVALVRPHKGRFVIATLALLLGSGMGLIYPQAARLAIDDGIRGGDTSALDSVLALLVAVFLANALFIWLRHYLMSWLGERAVADLRGLVFARLLTLPTTWFHERRSGELVGRLASDVTVIEGVVGSDLSIALRSIVQLFGGIILLFVVDWKLTLLMLAVVPPLVLGSVYFGKVIRRLAVLVRDRLAEASGQVQESVGGIQTVQAFVREEREARAYGRGVEAAFEQAISLARWRATFFAGVSSAGYIAIVGILWVGGRAVVAGDLSSGDLVAFILYTAMVASGLATVASLYGTLQKAAGATERLFAIIDTVPDIRDPDSPTALPDGRGSVKFDSVDFTYSSRPDHSVLSGVTLEVAPGEVVAFVGPSGAGKTTLVSLIMRFYDVTHGAVLFEGVDVRELRLADLRRAMALVEQEPILFSGTIGDNIGYARDDATTDAIERAARDANAHDFIVSFPDGYDTLVGERGIKLSGGQKQRIAIARALLADPRVLVLDEATSNLDAESEALVQQALARLMKERTTLLIAHRLSTVRDADRIVVLDGGRIAEQGTHDQLMAGDGTYRRLVEHQVIER